MRRTSSKLTIWFAAAALAAGTPVALLGRVKVHVNVDKKFDFKPVRTWAWTPGEPGHIMMGRTADDDPKAMQKLAEELRIWIPTSFFEADGPHYYNSLAMIGPDGKVAGVYRKSHIPDGPGYEEKFYFRPGNTGFKVWPGAGTTLGVGICWDQWYPETARAMMLMGAEILFYPTAIGTEPHDPDLDTSRLWRRAMIGHAVSNVVPVVAANRIGTEHGQRFYGHSFICDERGDMLAEFGADETGVLVATLDLAAAKKHRAAFGFFRDRRPELYGRLTEDI